MTLRKRLDPKLKPKTVYVATQSETDRLSMIVMQLNMALAIAQEKGLLEVQDYLEQAIARARAVRDQKLI